nr:MAG TPA: hypothetical protein [Bacteriophage sp.]
MILSPRECEICRIDWIAIFMKQILFPLIEQIISKGEVD